MKYSDDTISAISTPAGIGGISVIRISGKRAQEVVQSIFKSKTNISETESHKAIFGRIYDNGKLVDEVIVTSYHAPHSYTGEDVVEISCHGNPYITNHILELLLNKTRLAERGEFTQRAFLNNKLDLTQAEAVGDMLNAKTRISHLSALEQYEGSLHNKIVEYLDELTNYRSLLELEIDFLEQGLENTNKQELIVNLRKLLNNLKKLAKTGKEGRILREGLKVSLVGAPNVGKSSIFNSFLETGRAIVTPHPGTTRDYIEEVISLEGYMIRLFDTAGLRRTNDQIEKIGIQQSYDIIKKSHKILFIIDGNENEEEFQRLSKLVDSERIIPVLNKSDLLTETHLSKFLKKGYINCSAVEKDGLEDLKKTLLEDIKVSEEELHSGILTNIRQITAVNRCIDSITKAITSLNQKLGLEFTAFDLKEASSALEEIIGKITSEDILHQIFDNFCIGK